MITAEDAVDIVSSRAFVDGFGHSKVPTKSAYSEELQTMRRLYSFQILFAMTLVRSLPLMLQVASAFPSNAFIPRSLVAIPQSNTTTNITLTAPAIVPPPSLEGNDANVISDGVFMDVNNKWMYAAQSILLAPEWDD